MITEKLSAGDETECPRGYTELMTLDPRGVVSLNLDRFAGDALAKRYPGKTVTPVHGGEIPQKWTATRDDKCFLVQLQGTIDDPSNWIFTVDDLKSLLGADGHKYFLNYMYLKHIVLFVGVSANDIAFSQRMLELRMAGFKPDTIFWLTSRTDHETDNWASDIGIMPIRYYACNDSEHEKAIIYIVNDCLNYVSIDKVPLPNVSEGIDPEITGLETDPREIMRLPPNDIRIRLNRILANRLRKESASAYDIYDAFCHEYDLPLHTTFFRSKRQNQDYWLEYQLIFPSLGRGNFGEVYMAKKGDDQNPEHLVAIKIMHQSIVDNPEMLGSFRRGKEAMVILAKSKINGMVAVRDSYEIPASVIMDYVNGVSLEDFIRKYPHSAWLTKIKIAKKIAHIVSAGLCLPQTVLHKDIKPSNIIIKDMEYSFMFEPEVQVLDFDMSWYKGFTEKDVVFESRDDFAYLGT